MKKFLALALAAAMSVVLFSGCNEKTTGYKIGISQLVTHDALDKSYQGFKEGLEELGYKDGEKVHLEFKNAQNDKSNISTIAKQFVNDKKDLILAIATPTAVAVATETTDIPILVAAVTDPKSAKLVKDNSKPGTNVSGTSDLAPVKQQFEIIKEILPNAKKVGILYTSSESNSDYIIEVAKAEAKKLGLEIVLAPVSEQNVLQDVTENLVTKCDAIYIPNDNLIASSMSNVNIVTERARIPVFTAESGMMELGGVATYDTDYYQLGKQTAKMAVDILVNGKKPADMPIQYQETFALKLNHEMAAKIGLQFPQSVLDKEGK